jgi:hypothetical protein
MGRSVFTGRLILKSGQRKSEQNPPHLTFFGPKWKRPNFTPHLIFAMIAKAVEIHAFSVITLRQRSAFWLAFEVDYVWNIHILLEKR